MREQVEGLEDDPDPAPNPVQVDLAPGDLLAFHDDPAGVDRLEQVDAAQQGGLAAPEAPMRQITSCSATERSMPRSTSSFPNDL